MEPRNYDEASEQMRQRGTYGCPSSCSSLRSLPALASGNCWESSSYSEIDQLAVLIGEDEFDRVHAVNV